MSIAVEQEPTRVVMEGVSWSTFQALLKDLGEHRWRLTYDEGVLEFMSPYRDHQLVKTLIGAFIEHLTLELGIERRSGGSTTFARKDLKKGVEPDECYYLQSEAAVRHNRHADLLKEPPPDLVVEVDVSRSSQRRMGIYAAMGVPEVWQYQQEELLIWELQAGEYHRIPTSRVLPQMPLETVEALLKRRYEESETTLLRAFVDEVRRQKPEA